MLRTLIHKHDKIALQFSGGKDSLACLYLLKDFWEQIYVVWVNTGACYEETMIQMGEIKKMVPHFVEVKSNQPLDIKNNGFPTDILPVPNSHGGIDVKPLDVKLQPWTACCWSNLWNPMDHAMKELEVTLIIRGQKSSDYRTAPLKSGDVIDGTEYIFPLEQWSNDDCFEYLKSINVEIPSWYKWSDTSLDCWDCTACLDERGKELSNMPKIFPKKWEIVKSRLLLIERESKREMNILGEILNAN